MFSLTVQVPELNAFDLRYSWQGLLHNPSYVTVESVNSSISEIVFDLTIS